MVFVKGKKYKLIKVFAMDKKRGMSVGDILIFKRYSITDTENACGYFEIN
jgi:hypothetical protein